MKLHIMKLTKWSVNIAKSNNDVTFKRNNIAHTRYFNIITLVLSSSASSPVKTDLLKKICVDVVHTNYIIDFPIFCPVPLKCC